MRLLYRFAAFVLACAASFAQATPQHKVATGLWIDPNESGWGLNLFHQGDTVWASLFVYGPDGQPRWYTASDLKSLDDGPSHNHPAFVTGDLYEATGPYFGGTFNAAAVQRRKVGTMSLDMGATIADLRYTVDGVNVSKTIIAFTFDSDYIGGSFQGYIYDPVTGAQENIGIAIGTGSAFGMHSFGPTSGQCDYLGGTTYNRNFIVGSGTYSCDKGARGNWSMTVDATPDGWVGSFNGPGITSLSGRVAMSETGSSRFGNKGWRNDLWFPANESGWGVNILEQGETIFATLFVYDAQGKPRWYSASDLKRIGSEFDPQASFVGALQESTGPYFGTSFNAAAVTRRNVGTMSFKVQADGSGLLTYGVDGVGVSKVVQRYAFRKNAMAGTYLGHRMSPSGTIDPVQITIADDGAFTMDTSNRGFDGACHYTAPMAQVGEQRRMEGEFTCTSGRVGHWVMSNVTVTFDGFTSSFDGNGWTGGHLEGVRREQN